MDRRIASAALLVPHYDEAVTYFTKVLGFTVAVDAPRPNGERWIIVTPDSASGFGLRLVRARSDADGLAIGRQAGERVFLVMTTDDLARDHATFSQNGVAFLEPPRVEPYGLVAVFADAFGNRWDLIQPFP